jgi:CRISPR-associated protein Cas6
MYWQEDNKHDSHPSVPDDVVDIAYQIQCRTLPVDHAWALSEAVQRMLPWIKSEGGAGVHTVHVAESGNGWMRPEGAGALLHLSRRTRLQIRVPRHRVDDARNLVGMTLDVAGHALTVEKAMLKPLSAFPAVFSRYVVSERGQDENAFLTAMVRELGQLGIRPMKMLCGIEKTLATPDGPVRTRSLMLADLTLPESIRVQQRGLGPMRLLGCGLFLPHKDIREVGQAQE